MTEIISDPSIKLPEFLLSKDDLIKMKPRLRRDYLEGITLQLFKFNKDREFTLTQISDLLSVNRLTTEAILNRLLSLRDIYQTDDGKTVRFKANGRLAHPIKELKYELGRREYFFEVVMDDSQINYVIRESATDRFGHKHASGGIVIDAPFFDKFIQMLNDSRQILKKATEENIISEMRF